MRRRQQRPLDVDASLEAAIGARLQDYDEIMRQPLPERLAELVKRLRASGA
jgi:hypothetical protein